MHILAYFHTAQSEIHENVSPIFPSYLQAVKVSSDLVQREIELEVERRNQVEEEKRLKEEMKKRKLEAKKRRKEELLHHETELREKILKNWKEKVVCNNQICSCRSCCPFFT